MKRSRSCSPALSSRLFKRFPATACLTSDALKEHDRNTPPLSSFTLLDMASQERMGSLSDVPVMPPPSTRSSQRSRSSSPSRPSDAQYRRGPLRRANIYVDDEVPLDISDYAHNKVFTTLDNNDSCLHQVSEKLWSKSRELVRKPSGEAEWTEALYTAIGDLRSAGLDIARNRDWREDVKPPVHNPLPTIPRKRDQGNLPTDSRCPSPYFSQPVEPPIPVFRLKDPRPDICVGLSDENLASALEPKKGRGIARSLLFDLQDTSSLISDPHVTPLGLRFPFLIVEAKAGATGGNLYQAQNQAAVGGSTALQIFRNLSDLQDSDTRNHENMSNSTGSTQGLFIAFSVTTEGPIHELWLHFQRPKEEDFYMVCLGTWRTTLRDGSLNLLRHLSAILRWGNGELKDNIISALQGL